MQLTLILRRCLEQKCVDCSAHLQKIIMYLRNRCMPIAITCSHQACTWIVIGGDTITLRELSWFGACQDYPLVMNESCLGYHKRPAQD